MLVREPFFQARTAKGMETIQDSQRLVENLCAYRADELFFETCQSESSVGDPRAAGHICHL